MTLQSKSVSQLNEQIRNDLANDPNNLVYNVVYGKSERMFRVQEVKGKTEYLRELIDDMVRVNPRISHIVIKRRLEKDEMWIEFKRNFPTIYEKLTPPHIDSRIMSTLQYMCRIKSEQEIGKRSKEQGEEAIGTYLDQYLPPGFRNKIIPEKE